MAHFTKYIKCIYLLPVVIITLVSNLILGLSENSTPHSIHWFIVIFYLNATHWSGTPDFDAHLKPRYHFVGYIQYVYIYIHIIALYNPFPILLNNPEKPWFTQLWDHTEREKGYVHIGFLKRGIPKTIGFNTDMV